MALAHDKRGAGALRLAAVVCILAAGLGAWLSIRRGPAQAARLIVLGIDGMDPHLLREYMQRGEMPNFARLAQRGGFTELATTFPPQSPVAWSTVITGLGPGGHGIFDFIHRDPATLRPYLSTSAVDPPLHQIRLGQWLLPLTSARPRLLRQGKAFWQVLDEHRVPATVVRMPANFPPAPTRARTLAGMGTPDLLGGYGTFSFYTDDPFLPAGDVNGGRVYHVALQASRIDATLEGPPNPFRRDHAPVTSGFSVFVDEKEPAARIDLAGRRIVLRQGEWSEWVPVWFDLIPHVQGVAAICRFYLKEVRPNFRLYVSPLNLDPARPATAISTPAGYSRELARDCGPFYTQGIAEDTKALSSGVLSEAEYLQQARLVLDEEMRLFERELRRFQQGLFFYYFSTLDENGHMLWRSTERPAAGAPAGQATAATLEDLYREMDRALGKALAACDPNTTVVVLSDHGFAPFARSFNVNAWLAEHGYLAMRPEGVAGAEFPANIDWARTRAYSLGLNALYVNQKGREAQGIVAAGRDTDDLLKQLSAELLAVRDPLSGRPVLTRIAGGRELYGPGHARSAPDLVLGYNRGYRAGWSTVLGGALGAALEDNNDPWSGDHCIDPAFVPGVLLASRAIVAAHPALADIAPTILRELGVPIPPDMRGTPVLSPAAVEGGHKHVR